MTAYPDPIPATLAPGWSIVAFDPRRVRYFDDDREAMDETNYDVIRGGLDMDRECEPEITGHAYGSPIFAPMLATGDWAECEARMVTDDGWSHATPYVTSTVVLVVRDGSEAAEWVASCADQLAGYPLLDESAYCEREYEAWQQCWQDWAAREVAREAACRVAPDWPDDLADMLDDHRDEWAQAAHESASYSYGFSGEYDADGMERGCLEWLAGAVRVLDAVAATFATYDRAASGVLPLPLEV